MCVYIYKYDIRTNTISFFFKRWVCVGTNIYVSFIGFYMCLLDFQQWRPLHLVSLKMESELLNATKIIIIEYIKI